MKNHFRMREELLRKLIAVLLLVYVVNSQIIDPLKKITDNKLDHPSDFAGKYVINIGSTTSVISMIGFPILPS